MTLYAIYDPQPGRPELPAAIPERFSWFAALLPPAFLLRHGLWLETLAWAIKLVVLVLLSAVIGGDAVFALYVLAALWLGLAASGLRRHGLAWRGWSFRDNRVALSDDMARLEAIR
ncbi:MAG: DUF2628 domain-containing protein [Candidatus Devosia phytovorans]|uniref:DUF2628 domain-containing protein n=1 Tax=Candidatus Devosia phytovorans TaxID=3121372 RepID=A0AAJ5VSU2_9HYPH|nr:DUF2628 domain-containing protein [Devosia sp.]WEK04181.1 MAG: DUF2628 domain-containing protein [Devosia sp.]